MNKTGLSRRTFIKNLGLGTVTLFTSQALFRCNRSSSSDSAAKPNIIYILADDLGYGDLGCYGQKRIKTPVIDKLAAEGMKFTDHYAGSTVCAPSRCCLMTGLHTGHAFIRGNAKIDLRPEDTTVAELLKQAGYTSGIIGKWGLGTEGSTGTPCNKGFDSFFGYMDQTHAHNYYTHFLNRDETRVQLKNVVPNPGKHGQGVATKKVEYSHDLFAEEALNFVESNKEKPFFLYLALTIPHANNQAGKEGMEVPSGEPYTKETWPQQQKNHAAMITRMDKDIGRLMAKLKQLEIDNNTLVIFTSDNGPHREGGNDPDFNDSNGPLRGIKRDLYEGGIRVPMIARWPGYIKAGSISNHVSAFWDMLPTFAELAGVKAPENIDGISIAPTLTGKPEQQKKHDFLYWEFHERGSKQAVRMGDWKAVKLAKDAKLELYNLKTDISEENNVAEKHPEIIEKIETYLATARTESEIWNLK